MSLSILPRVSRACPGDVIEAQYTLRFADGTSETLGRGEIASLVRKSDQAEPRSDGSWQTSASSLEAAISGFRLSASLAADSSIHGDTVVAPAPECRHAPINLVSSRNNTVSAHLRLGAMSTPFFDSIAVAVLEIGGAASTITVLTPAEMKSGAIRVFAAGRDGRAGRSGRQGDNGDECQNGGSGDDGDPGDPGQPGGQVDIIVQTDAPWLADLVSVSNPGGHGGRGGAGGMGGSAGPRSRNGRNCNTRAGVNGRSGIPGPDGAAGLPPHVTTVPFTLLWTGSPIWTDEHARSSLEALMQYTRQRAR